VSEVRVAVVGAGRFGEEHLRAYRGIPEARLVGVVDADAARAAEAGRRHGAPGFASVGQMLREARPDAVSLVVPANARGEILGELAGRGLAVLVEKPLAESWPQARSLAETWRDRPVMTGHVLRFAEPYRRLRDAVRRAGSASGGSSSRIRGAEHLEDYPGEGVVRLTMIHDLDALLWMTGASPTRVSARGRRTAEGRWQEVEAEIALDSGGVWRAIAAWTGPAEDRMSVAGAELAITAERSTLVRAGEQNEGPGSGPAYDAALVAELAHFVGCAREGVPSPELSLADAATAVRLADAVHASLDREGDSVELA